MDPFAASQAPRLTVSTLASAVIGGLRHQRQLHDAQVKQHELEWIWVKGHAGHPENERADALFSRGIDELKDVT